ncbi:hypothetical protein [Micromonospora echinaurantiaca]|uniref:hypothetical protein n=1 Tax=Micromonospora echinaurantiaca TaxID=47857 RepID=UPI00379E5FB8
MPMPPRGEIVGLATRVDGPTDLGHPQRDTVVVEQRNGEPTWLPYKARCGSP